MTPAVLFLVAAAEGQSPFGGTGKSRSTTIVEGPGPDGVCSEILDCNWDGTVEYGYCWAFGGVQPPDYGAFAEGYDNSFVCEAQFYWTQTGYYVAANFDLYVWDDAGGLPGNVLCSRMGLSPGPIAFWPSCSTHTFELNCVTSGSHFLGYWGDWPGSYCHWFVCSDEDGPLGRPVTKVAPGLGYSTGWNPMPEIPEFAGVKSLGICEWTVASEEGACCVGEECFENVTGAECESMGGLWQPGGCDPNPCVGACCRGQLCVLTNKDNCLAQGGEWLDGPCEDPNPCLPTAACCVGETCIVTNFGDCLDQGGEWNGWPTCEPSPCEQTFEGVVLAVHGNVACVETNGDPCADIELPAVCEEMDPNACPDASGVEWYLAVAAGPKPLAFTTITFGIGSYDPSSCRIADYGPCRMDLSPLEIPSSGWPDPNTGTAVSWAPNCLEGDLVPVYYFGVYVYGDGGPVPLGDFYPNQTPSIVSCDQPPTETVIEGFGVMGCGSFTGSKVCPFMDGPGACCLPDGTCVLLTEAECSADGYSYVGGSCEPNPCLPVRTEHRTWGQIKRMYLR